MGQAFHAHVGFRSAWSDWEQETRTESICSLIHKVLLIVTPKISILSTRCMPGTGGGSEDELVRGLRKIILRVLLWFSLKLLF